MKSKILIAFILLFWGDLAHSQTVSTLASSGLSNLRGITMDDTGNVYVPELSANRIRKITPSGVVSTYCNSGLSGPAFCVFDSKGNLYVTNFTSTTISKIPPGGGAASTFANVSPSNPFAIIIYSGDTLITGGYSDQRMYKITPGGTVIPIQNTSLGIFNASNWRLTVIAPYPNGDLMVGVTFAGVSATRLYRMNKNSFAFSLMNASGPQTSQGLAPMPGSKFLASTYYERKIYLLDSTGSASLYAGTGAAGGTDGAALSATFSEPQGLYTDANGNAWLAETAGRVRKIFNCANINITLSGNACVGNIIDFNADVTLGGVLKTFQWSGPDGFTSNIKDTQRAITSTSQWGVYKLVVTDSIGCRDSAMVSIPPAEICGNGIDDNCNGKKEENCGPNYWLGHTATWNDSNNWSLKKVPDADDHARIPSGKPFNPLIGVNAWVGSMQIDGGASVKVDVKKWLRVDTVFTNNGSLELENQASLLPGYKYSQAGSGLYCIKRISGNKNIGQYNFWSSPVTLAYVSQLPGNPLDKYRFDKGGEFTSDFKNVAGTHAMAVGEGYTATGDANDDVTFCGTANNGNINVTIAEFGSSKIYNLVGNPYPSGLNAKLFVDDNDTEIERAIYLFSQKNLITAMSTDDYIVFNDLGNTSGFSGTRAQKLADLNIGSCQGFMVAAKATGSITFKNEHRNADNENFYKKNILGRIWVDVISPENRMSETLIGIADDATHAYDNGYDAPKVSMNSSLNLYSKSGNDNLAIQGVPPDEHHTVIPLGLITHAVGTHTFKLGAKEDLEDYVVELEDRQTRLFFNLEKSDAKIYLSPTAVTNEGRFFLHLKSSRLKYGQELQASIYTAGGFIYAELTGGAENINQVIVYDLTGRRVLYLTEISGKKAALDASSLQSGIYVVSVATEIGMANAKILIK